MGKRINIKKGDKYGKLTLTGKDKFERRGKRKDRVRFVECICECGNVLWIDLHSVRKGNTKSCGCLFKTTVKELGRNLNFKHGLWIGHNRFARIYQGMKRRCNNKNDISYQLYGGRGISCEWDSIKDFYDDMYPSYIEHCNKYGENNTTLDRIDSNGNYCKENCRWATYIEQANNTSKNVYIEYKGKKYTLRQLSELSGIKMGTLKFRLLARQDIDRAVEEPVHSFN